MPFPPPQKDIQIDREDADIHPDDELGEMGTKSCFTDRGANGYVENLPITVSAWWDEGRQSILLNNYPDNGELDYNKLKRN